MSTDNPEVLSDLVLRRVQGEFLEMPGLRLTCQQAQRLWGLDATTCLALLDRLVETQFLQRSGGGLYGRLTDGRRERSRSLVGTPACHQTVRHISEAI